MDGKSWVDSYLAADERRRAALDPGVESEAVCREVLARMHDVTPEQRGALVSLLSRIRLGNSAIRIFETLIDVNAPLDERAVAFIVLSNCDPQLIAERPHAVPDLAAVSTRSLELTLDMANPARTSAPKAPAEAPATDAPSLQIRVTLSGIEPPVWRRLIVASSSTLAELDGVIRSSMGWSGRHQHLFHVGSDVYGRKHPDLPDVRSERRMKLSSLLARNVRTFAYTYNLGSGWQHDVTIEGSLPRDASAEVPLCTSGERACPPEDCGGTAGYASLLADPTARDFDPEAFSVDEANARLGRSSA